MNRRGVTEMAWIIPIALILLLWFAWSLARAASKDPPSPTPTTGAVRPCPVEAGDEGTKGRMDP